MRKGDILWAFIIVCIAFFLIIQEGRTAYLNFDRHFPYLSGFIKFAVLATMGELLTLRIREGMWRLTVGFPIKTVIWGIIGMAITFMFTFYNSGVIVLQNRGVLPGEEKPVITAFFTALLMNLTFGPAFMSAHRISDTFIDAKMTEGKILSFKELLKRINWSRYLFVIITALLFFWIPVHTIVFLLPESYRVLMAAFLSIMLGFVLSLAEGKKEESVRGSNE